MLVWGITDGSAGMVAQVRALAALLHLSVEIKTLTLPAPYVWLPNYFYASRWGKQVAAFLLQRRVQGVAPHMVISCGRRGAAAAMALRLLMPKTKFICIQDPRVASHHFDLVVAMQHDAIEGPNVIKIRYALHNITPEKLARARTQFAPVFAAYAKPQVAVLLGGSTNKYTLGADAMRDVISQLSRLLDRTPCSLLITPSRRTGENNIKTLDAQFDGNKRVYVYDFKGENPYMGLLALADYIVVTNDSVNMMSEAVATGKPLYILPLAGHNNTKPARFAEGLVADGIARNLGDTLEGWNYVVPDEMNKLAENVRSKMEM